MVRYWNPPPEPISLSSAFFRSPQSLAGGPRGSGRRRASQQPPPRAPHASDQVLGAGVTYVVKYLGCIEVLRSMRSLDFSTRTQITREAISRVCEAVPGAKGAFRRRKPPSKMLSSILGKSNLQFAGMSISLTISTASLNLRTPDSKQIIANHHMQSISFASGGDPDTTDYVAYVAKDPVNRRGKQCLTPAVSQPHAARLHAGLQTFLIISAPLADPSVCPDAVSDRGGLWAGKCGSILGRVGRRWRP